jgi:phosphoribosylformylglycinamidine (FGAM) synthase-like amidotransferase family enzyme
MMPHPEHACDALVGAGEDGLAVFASVLNSRIAA